MTKNEIPYPGDNTDKTFDIEELDSFQFLGALREIALRRHITRGG